MNVANSNVYCTLKQRIQFSKVNLSSCKGRPLGASKRIWFKSCNFSLHPSACLWSAPLFASSGVHTAVQLGKLTHVTIPQKFYLLCLRLQLYLSTTSKKVIRIILQVMRHFIEAEKSASCQLPEKAHRDNWDGSENAGMKVAFVFIRFLFLCVCECSCSPPLNRSPELANLASRIWMGFMCTASPSIILSLTKMTPAIWAHSFKSPGLICIHALTRADTRWHARNGFHVGSQGSSQL